MVLMTIVFMGFINQLITGGVTLYKSHESPAFLRRFLTESAAFFVAGAGDGMPVWLQYCGRGLGPPLGPGDPPKVGIFIF